MEKIVVTLIGKDTVGIIAKVCTYFAEHEMNILDISQTTMRDVISMTMIVDASDKRFEDVENGIKELSKNVRCIISIEKESVLEDLARSEI